MHYDVPSEFSNLTIAKKDVNTEGFATSSSYYIKNGMLGSRGHILSFYQDIKGICFVLSRLPGQVNIVKVIQASVNRHGESMKNAFAINRRRVTNALNWLKEYNPLYHYIRQ